MKKFFLIPFFSVFALLSFMTIGHAQNTESTIGVRIVGAGVLNVRSEPMMGNNIIGTVNYGERVTVINKDATGLWCHIQFDNRDNSWVYCPFLMMAPAVDKGQAQTDQGGQTVQSAQGGQPRGAADTTQGGNAIVNVGALNVRSEPRMGNNVVGYVRRGDAVTILQRDDSGFWCKIDFAGVDSAWVACSYLKGGQTAQSGQGQLKGAADATQGGNATVNVGSLNVRSEPRMGSNVVGYVRRGDAVTILQRDDSGFWCKINFAGVDSAWVACKFLK